MGPGANYLEALDAYLMSDEAPANCMLLSDLDGFLTGIVVGPELIQPSEWLPVVWHGASPAFHSTEQAELILGAIMARYNEIARSLAEVPPGIDPIFWETEDGFVIAGDWAEGFMDAMRLRPEAWTELLDDEKAAISLVPILAFASDEDDPLLALESEERKTLAAQAPDLIPSCVVEIDAYWKARRPPHSPPARGSGKPGRNDPCPCGSGRKYKRCCGAH